MAPRQADREQLVSAGEWPSTENAASDSRRAVSDVPIQDLFTAQQMTAMRSSEPISR